MKKRVSTLLLSGALCVSMVTPAFAADRIPANNGSANMGSSSAGETVVVVKKDDDGYTFVGTTTVGSDGKVSIDGVEIGDGYGVMVGDSADDIHWVGNDQQSGGETGGGSGGGSGSGGGTSSGSSTPSGGAAGASSKYITNTQPVTQKPADTGVDSGWTSNSAGRFSDVPAGEWYYDAVLYVGSNGIMAGSNGLFSPNDKLTRGMMAQILYNIESAPGGTSAVFPDVSSTDWFASAATWASSCGYMSGYGNGNFGPLDPITREQLATILFRYAGSKGYNVSASAALTFSDAGTTSDWALPAMQWAVGSGLLSGKTGVAGTRLDPLGNATRAEVAQILMNFMQKIAK